MASLQNKAVLFSKQKREKSSWFSFAIPCVIVSIGALTTTWTAFTWRLHNKESLNTSTKSQALNTFVEKRRPIPKCDLRMYPPHRYYHLNDPSPPDFLLTDYIYGKWPMLLDGKQHIPTKLCVDQSEWWTAPNRRTLPFADGTNPSILTMQRLQQEAPSVYESIIQHYPNAVALVTICMTNSQCVWHTNRTESSEKPATIRTVLQIVDEYYIAVAQATIYLQLDAPWGRKKVPIVESGDGDSRFKMIMPALDDARLFIHADAIWISFREGPGFGYETQVLHPIHLQFLPQEDNNTNTNSDGKVPLKTSLLFQATIKASQVETLCCGRNMALLPTSRELKAVTWVDPVTIETVQFKNVQQQSRRRRRLASSTKKKSHIHGTNAFMVQLPGNDSYLGIAHFHRPNDRDPNPYARFGHHYTHAFYTISLENQLLTGLSREFVLVSPMSYDENDAEIIQFISGLELDATTTTTTALSNESPDVILAYGINDCEAAITTMSLKMVLSLIQPVPPGTQVVDLMKPLQQ